MSKASAKDDAKGAKANIPNVLNPRGVVSGSTFRPMISARGHALHEEGCAFYNQGKVNEAMDRWHEALEVKEEECGVDSFEVAETLNNIATVQAARNEVALALENYKKAYAAMKRELGNDALVATILFNIGKLHNKIGEIEEAEECFKEALSIYEESPGDNRIDIADTLYTMGELYYAKQEYKPALDYSRKALNMREAALGMDHIDVARALTNIGNAHMKLGENQEAEKCYDRALAITVHTYGRSHVEVASLLSNLASIYNKTSRYDEAFKNLEEALDIRKDLLGQEHEDVGKIHWELGSTFVQNNQGTEGLVSWEEALRIQKTTLGNHEDTAQTLYFMALVHGSLGHPVKAILCYEEALAVYRAIGRDDDDSRVASIIENLDVLRKRTGKTTIA